MKSWLLKLIAGETVRRAVSYALRTLDRTIDALRGVLNGDTLTPEQSATVSSVVNALMAVRAFIERLAEIFGSEPIDELFGVYGASQPSDLDDLAGRLRRLVDAL